MKTNLLKRRVVFKGADALPDQLKGCAVAEGIIRAVWNDGDSLCLGIQTEEDLVSCNCAHIVFRGKD